MLDFPVAPPIFVKDTPLKRKIVTLTEARANVNEMLHQRRLYKLRRLKTVSTASKQKMKPLRQSAHCANY